MADPAMLAGLRETLVARCDQCRGLCCVIPAFTRSSQFALDKPAGVPCPNLQGDSLCAIHDHLRERGFPGCTAYDCFGAGQAVCAAIAPPAGWVTDVASASLVTAVFGTVRDLHELAWHVSDAMRHPLAPPLAAALATQLGLLREAASRPPEELAALDTAGFWRSTSDLITRASLALRGPGHAEHPRADLVGRDLRHRALQGANLRGALLLGADLRGVDLARADLLGADLRDARVQGALLADALFLSPMAAASALGDTTTTLPPQVPRPGHWAGTGRGAQSTG